MKRLYLLCLLALMVSCSGFQSGPLDAQGFKSMLEKYDNVQLIDVRTFDEFSSGHLVDAYNIDFRSPGFRENLDTLDRNRPVAVYCMVGGRSAKAYDMLAEMGFTKITHLEGGTEAWRRANFKLETGKGRYTNQ